MISADTSTRLVAMRKMPSLGGPVLPPGLLPRGREGVTLMQPEEVLAGAPEATRRLRLPFRWQVDVRESEKLHRLGVEPDRVFGLRFADAPEGRKIAYFFLEADRGTMPVARKGLGQTSFRRKLLAYQETWRQGLHRAHLGIPNFRVLTVTTSEERVRHLVAACRSLGGGSRLFLFADQGALGRGTILAYEWVNGRNESAPLLPGPAVQIADRRGQGQDALPLACR